MAFGDDPYGKNYALCAVAGNMVNLKLEVRDVLRRAGCSGFFVFRFLTFSLSYLLTCVLPFYFFTFLPLKFFRLQNPESLICVLGNNIINNHFKQQTIMEIRNILRTGYKVLVVTVTLIEAFELGKNLIGRCNKKTVGVSDTAVDTNDVESA